MSLLSTHLEQILLSSESIATLPFPPPKIFTNALLAPHDITVLIRDTEPHERALFSVPPPPPPATSQSHYADPKPNAPTRRQTVFNVTSGEVTSSAATSSRVPRRNTAVAAVLGVDLSSEIRRSESQHKGEINVEVLLRGAEKLGEVYAIEGAKEKITALRTRYGRLKTSVERYEAKVARQSRELEKMNRQGGWEGESGSEEDENDLGQADEELIVTEEDLKREEEEIRELERKKKELEDRVSGMERDLGGLLR